MKNLLLACSLLCWGILQAQPMRYKGGPGGALAFGQRTTLSTFNDDDERSALGVGGQFRLRLGERVNTEWFVDYLPATNSYTRRADYHIGWSVLFYPLSTGEKLFTPYVLAGHCFDYTQHTDLSDPANGIERWSSAVQAGIGTHVALSERIDMSVSGQYMIHLGTDVHAHAEGGEVEFERHSGGSLEGHLLFTVSFNYTFTDLWKRD